MTKMSKKKTHEEFLKEINKVNTNIKIIWQYKTARDTIKVKCLNCTGEWEPTADSLLHKHGCPYCCHTPKKILIGFNDMWTTNQKLAELLANKEDGYKYTQYSNKKVDWKCKDCGNIIRNKTISDISLKGFICPKCGDGVSYPEKFMFNSLKQLLNKGFQTQLNKSTFKWCKNYKYDFYINEIYGIVETGGLQHYEDIKKGLWQSLEETQENDFDKEWLARKSGIKNYIIIDCRKSDMEWIKKSIMKSRLPILLGFKEEDIDWLKCHEYACSSLVKVVCDYWNNGIKNICDIVDITDLHRDTIRKYLKQGVELGWCDYNAKEESIKNIENNKILNSKKVKCIETGIIFNSITEAIGKIFDVKAYKISQCCKGERKFCGKLEDGTKLHWEYV